MVLGTTGYVSLDAVRWLADAGIPMVQIDPEGRLLLASQPMGRDLAVLRRSQAWATTNETGLEITRYLLDRKLEGQAHIAERLGGNRSEIDAANRQLEEVGSLDGLLWLEASAAAHYWHVWSDVECPFVNKHKSRVPDHWHRFGTRGSNYSAPGARGAANPINAMLNYLYALLEAEAVFAIQAVGLDPGIGILHSDQRARDSFALDLMEPVRPLVDQWLLDFLRDRKLRASDFADTRRGVCRIHPVLTHWLATTTIEWATALEPHARHVAQILTDTPNIRIDRVPSPLIGAKKPRTTPPKRENSPRESSDLERVCQVCGASTSNGRKLCDECLPDVHAAHVQEMVAGAHERLRELRIRGEDPSHGGEAAAKRGSANQEHQKHIKEWDRNDAQNPVTDFQEQILPLLQDVPLAVMAKATGLSGGYCSYIKRGIKIPHERHWQSLQDVGDS